MEASVNIAIIGNSRYNGIIRKYLAACGFIPFVFEDAGDIKEFGGEKGCFAIKTAANLIEAGYIIITEQPVKAPSFGIDNPDAAPPLTLESADRMDFSKDRRMPVVFILDHPYESAPWTTAAALEKAVALAAKKRRVIYLSRFMRTADSGLEDLYRRGRNLGITFIKFSSIAIGYDAGSGIYRVDVKDEFNENISIDAGVLITAERAAPGGNMAKIAKTLRLRHDSEGFIEGSRHFLFPATTNRKGIFFLHGGVPAENEDEAMSRVRHIAAGIRCEFDKSAEIKTSCMKTPGMPLVCSGNGIASKPDGYAAIDAGKCAFCYTCYRACPHSAMEPDFKNSVMKNLNNNCCSCGICASVCPAGAISMSSRKDDGTAVPGSGEKADRTADFEPGTIEILCCENSGEAAVKRLVDGLKESFWKITVTPVSCGGEISAKRIVGALKRYENVIVAVCIDNACKHFEGNKSACRQAEKAIRLLKTSGMDETRVKIVKLSHAMPEALKEFIGCNWG